MKIEAGQAILDNQDQLNVFDHVTVRLVAKEVEYRRNFQIILLGKSSQSKEKSQPMEVEPSLTKAVKKSKKR